MFNIKRKYVVVFGLAVMLVLAGCAGQSDDTNEEELAEDSGLDIDGANVGDSYWLEIKYTEKNQKELVQNQPPKGMDQSLERQNLKDRYEYLNDQNNQHYVYLLSHGKVVTWFTAQGKVSSVNSKLTNDRQIVKAEGCKTSGNGYSNGDCFKVVESPQMDGSYGTNGDAIFFFTTDGKYVQWNGEYVVSEQPLNVQTPPELTQQLDDDEEATGPTSEDDQPGDEGNETEDGH